MTETEGGSLASGEELAAYLDKQGRLKPGVRYGVRNTDKGYVIDIDAVNCMGETFPVRWYESLPAGDKKEDNPTVYV